MTSFEVLCCLSLFGAVSAESWPQPESLQLLIPFTGSESADDIVCKSTFSKTGSVKLNMDLKGPANKDATSYSTMSNNGIGSISNFPISKGLTISLFYYSPLNVATSAIIQVVSNDKRLQLLKINSSKLQSQSIAPTAGIPVITSANAISPNWTFLSFSYNSSIEKAILYMPTYPISIMSSIFAKLNDFGESVNVNITFGKMEVYKYDEGDIVGVSDVIMSDQDAISCLSVYNSTLTESEVSEIKKACEQQLFPKANKALCAEATTTSKSSTTTLMGNNENDDNAGPALVGTFVLVLVLVALPNI